MPMPVDPAGTDPAPCPFCAGTSYSWGALRDGRSAVPRFVPDDAPWLSRNFGFTGQATQARLCLTCGNLQLFTAP